MARTHEAWTIDKVCAAFKGAKKTDVEEVLESLEALGLLTGYPPLEGYFVSQTTPAAVQNVPLVLPDEPLWQSGKAVLGQSLLLDVSAHCVVHAANNCA